MLRVSAPGLSQGANHYQQRDTLRAKDPIGDEVFRVLSKILSASVLAPLGMTGFSASSKNPPFCWPMSYATVAQAARLPASEYIAMTFSGGVSIWILWVGASI